MDAHTNRLLVARLVGAQRAIEEAKDNLTHVVVIMGEHMLQNTMLYRKVSTMRNTLYADQITKQDGGDSKYFCPADFVPEAVQLIDGPNNVTGETK